MSDFHNQIFDRQATIDDALRIHAERFGRENYDEFDSNAQLRGRSTDRTVKPDFKKSMCSTWPSKKKNAAD